MEDYNQAIKLDPYNSTFYLNRGYGFQDLRSDIDACKDFKKAYDIEPDQYKEWFKSKEMTWCRNMPN